MAYPQPDGVNGETGIVMVADVAKGHAPKGHDSDGAVAAGGSVAAVAIETRTGRFQLFPTKIASGLFNCIGNCARLCAAHAPYPATTPWIFGQAATCPAICGRNRYCGTSHIFLAHAA